jgi:hypothetical protein
MSRFIPVWRASWLALKRNGCSRDLRGLILRLIERNIFDWETEGLINARCQLMALRYMCENRLFLGGIPVEVCPAFPFPTGADVGLCLQRVKAKVHKFLPMQNLWLWLHPQLHDAGQ